MTIKPGNWIIFRREWTKLIASEVVKTTSKLVVTKHKCSNKRSRVSLERVLFCGTQAAVEGIMEKLAMSKALYDAEICKANGRWQTRNIIIIGRAIVPSPGRE
jgi:hypothetical protein